VDSGCSLSYLALEKWSLGPEHLHPHNPSLIFTRVSGYGQTGPLAPRPGYASVCEAESGFRYINGFPDPEIGGLAGPPVRPNISLGDSVAGLHAAFGTVRITGYIIVSGELKMVRFWHY
jgi:crotonobetainyl-CoA:carnitine CoA-transferase CaiB-like acyl-CoA transferase